MRLHAFATIIHIGNFKLRFLVILFGGKFKPGESVFHVGRSAAALFIHLAYIELRLGVTRASQFHLFIKTFLPDVVFGCGVVRLSGIHQ